MEEVLTVEELAEKLKVTPWTVRYWARQKRIPFLRPGRKSLRFILSEVLQALKQEPALK